MTDNKDDMTADERLAWLRERGVQIETAEDRGSDQRKKISSGQDVSSNAESVSFVHVPHDISKPLRELFFSPGDKSAGGDLLPQHLKTVFGGSGEEVDLDLFRDQATKHLGTDDAPKAVSETALRAVASQGSVETFCLVHAVPSNKYQGVNVYLDEVGMLKRLPQNKRASDYALRVGFNPPPKFYGDVFIGRVANKPVVRNVNFHLGDDTSPDAPWLQRATMENLEYQTAMNDLTGKSNQVQPATDGEDGVAKTERGGLYSWTQTDEEIELVVPLPSSSDASSRDVKVSFRPTSIRVVFRGGEVMALDLYSRVDPDGCTWTLEKADDDEKKVVITCEKSDETSWPRISH